MLEKAVERLLFASRWLLAPLYFGLSLALLILGVKFFQGAFHVISEVFVAGGGGPGAGVLAHGRSGRWWPA